MLSSRDLSRHWSLSPATIRAYVASGALRGCRVNRALRFDWEAVWALEAGPTPRSAQTGRYRTALLTKRDLADALGVSMRTIDRLLERGLPTRNVGTNVRLNGADVADWLALHAGVDLHIVARKVPDLHGRPRKQRRFIYGHACANGADTPLAAREQSANISRPRTVRPCGCGRTVRDGDRK